MGRKLTVGELNILKLVQQEYGPQNSVKDVVFGDEDQAAIFVKDRDGTIPIMIGLTALALMYDNGMIKSYDELINEWIHIPSEYRHEQ